MERQISAVEWLVEQVISLQSKGLKLSKKYDKKLIEQAKQIEKEQMCKFTNDYVLTQCEASFEGNVSAEMSAEEYYELIFKSE